MISILKLWQKFLSAVSKGNSVYYIGGTDVLPPPLEPEAEAEYIEMMQNDKAKYFVTIEDNVFLGGFGAMFNNQCLRLKKDVKVKNFAYYDQFITHGKVGDLQKEYGVNGQDIEDYLLEVLV